MVHSSQVNPGNAPLVVGQLLDDECPEDFIKGLILSVRSLLPVEPLVDECEKRQGPICVFAPSIMVTCLIWILTLSIILGIGFDCLPSSWSI